MKNKNVKKRIIIVLSSAVLILVLCFLTGVAAVFGIDAYVKNTAKKSIITEAEAAELTDIDCVLVLGCKVNGDRPSDMLEDRLLCGINVYNSGAAPKMLVSGDHGTVGYDEANVMKQYAMDKGVPSDDVFMDHAGFSTYESVYRAKEVFGVKKMIIVTQSYHLYRAVYIARQLGIEAYGVPSDYDWYVAEFQRNVREILARNKDFFAVIFDVKPTYLGEMIPISGDGNLTND